MSVWAEIRALARQRHSELSPSQNLPSAWVLIAAAEKSTGIVCSAAAPDDAFLDGADAAYNRDLKRIYYSSVTDNAVAAFHIAHEFGHHWLDLSAAACAATEIDPITPAEPEMSLVGDVDAYSPKERTEAQANLFAREFLLPRGKLKVQHTGKTAQEIAAIVGVTADLVMQQLADAQLLPPERSVSQSARTEPDPDATQQRAIDAAVGAHRVRASPGTGKTRTLVGRVKKLIGDGVDPNSILVLTYSNLAARDLARRIQMTIGEPALAIWSGTFHAYGYELLRKFSIEAGFKKAPLLIDRAASLALLEDLLPQLRLSHYLNLRDPLEQLTHVANLISRAKDELAPPARYAELAQPLLQSADDDEKLEGAKALEVAHAYEVYEQALRQRDQVDFGDLIARPVVLFLEKPSVRDSARLLRKHVLVDEYQDVNRASAVLLQELVTPGTGPWVVGDARQSIYRFRGASPINMGKFEEDFPGATTTNLGVNYRSGGRIVRTFEAFGRDMLGTDPLGTIKPDRGQSTGEIAYDVAQSKEAEAEGIAREAKRLADEKIAPFADQAIIARSHVALVKLAEHLERVGIPCLYFGNFFERPEIRDLLSVLSLVSEWRGIGLFRVARFARYDLSHDDLMRVVAWRSERAISMLDAVRQHAKIPDISAPGKQALVRLALDLAPAQFAMPPHRFLLLYLFGGSNFLNAFLADDEVATQQCRLAIYQLLQFAFSFRATQNADPKRSILAHIRRLEALDDEKQLRQLPAAAGDIDALRLMTVHASKGLEFPVVHIPYLTDRHFPINRPETNPPPPGLAETGGLMSRAAEEESLFFVALSRAQNVLRLSRNIKYGGGSWSNLKPSPYLARIAKHLPRGIDAPANWTEETSGTRHHAALAAKLENSEWPVNALETYADCPRRFYYEQVLKLGGDDTTAPYVPFHGALQSSIASLRGLASREERHKAALAHLNKSFADSALSGHKLETLYRAAASDMIVTAIDFLDGTCLPTELALEISGIRIRARAEHIGDVNGKIIVRRFKATKLSKEETRKARYTIVEAALVARHGSVTFEHISLVDGARQDGTTRSRKLATEVEKLKTALARIATGDFAPAPDARRCPGCAYFFICPSHGPVL